MTAIFMREICTQTHPQREDNHMSTEAEIGVMEQLVKECQLSARPEARKKQRRLPS